MSSVTAGRRDRQSGDRRAEPGFSRDEHRAAASGGRAGTDGGPGGELGAAGPASAAGVGVSLQGRLRAGRSGGPILRIFPAASHRDHVMAACEGVVDLAATLFNVSGKELRSAGRSTLAVSRVRQIAMYVAHVTLGFTMANVGQGFGRDRTTVLHACHLVEDMREDAEFDDIVARVEQVVAAAFGGRLHQGRSAG